MIGIVDYGVGNVGAFLNVFRRLGTPALPIRQPEEFAQVSRIILPGVGSFDHAMERLNRSGLRAPLERAVLEQQRPVLGVCVGMQMLATRSDEGKLPGLDWVPGSVVRLQGDGSSAALRLPHMGWNDVEPTSVGCLFRDCAAPRFYFLHSYWLDPEDREHVLAVSEYGQRIVAAVRKGHIWGTQFHPEKSHDWGCTVLANFARGDMHAAA